MATTTTKVCDGKRKTKGRFWGGRKPLPLGVGGCPADSGGKNPAKGVRGTPCKLPKGFWYNLLHQKIWRFEKTMANAQKYTKSACGHMTAHYERAKDENGEYIKFGNQNIDPSRTHLNYNLAPLRVSDGVSGVSGQIDFIRQRTTEARTLNRADVNVMVSWVVTLPKYQKIVTDPNIAHVSFDKDMAEGCSSREHTTSSLTDTVRRMWCLPMFTWTRSRHICTLHLCR